MKIKQQKVKFKKEGLFWRKDNVQYGRLTGLGKDALNSKYQNIILIW